MAVCPKCGKKIDHLIINELRDYKEIFCHHPNNLEKKLVLEWGGKGQDTYSYRWLCPECMQPIFPDGPESQKLVEAFLKDDVISLEELMKYFLKLKG